MKELISLKALDSYPTPNQIIVLGCGGTGGYVVAFLSRFLSSYRNTVRFIIADGDTVEQKNLSRQHFTEYDLGKNKAVALAERYSGAFGIDFEVIDEEVKSLSKWAKSRSLIIGCVDNNASRRMIHNSFKNGFQDSFWIDAGNEESSGQVVCGYKGYYSGSRYFDKAYILCHLPFVTEIYPEILKDETVFNSDLSCAERAMSAPQNMMSNITAATLIMNYVQLIMTGSPIRNNAVEFTNKNAFNVRLNTEENLKVLGPLQ